MPLTRLGQIQNNCLYNTFTKTSYQAAKKWNNQMKMNQDTLFIKITVTFSSKQTRLKKSDK